MPLVFASGCKPHETAATQPSVVRYQVAQPAAQTPSRALYVGILRGDPETDLSFRVGGILERIGPSDGGEDWREGVVVTKGQLLARLKQEDFNSAVDNEKANLKLAEAIFDRTERLLRDRTVSQQELDVAQAKRDSARAALRKAEEALADSKIYAPHAGVMVARFANAGETIPAGKTVLSVANIDRMALEVGVPDTRISQVTNGMKLQAAVSAFAGRQFDGEVSEVGVAAKAGSRLFRVVVQIPNPHRLFKAGMSATVDFGAAVPLSPGAVLVPLSALITSARGDGTNHLAVFVLEPEGNLLRARERKVVTGDITHSSIQITDGLRLGEKVVTFGAADLYDGAPVTAISEGGSTKEQP